MGTIHRCLTGDFAPQHKLNFRAGKHPLKFVVLGGAPLLEGQRTLHYTHSEEVPAVAKALAKLERKWLHKQFFSLPPNQYHEITEDFFENLWEEVQKLTELYRKAAAEGRAVCCTISH